MGQTKDSTTSNCEKSYAFGDWEEWKRMMELIRTKYFDNRAPKKPGSYWERPRTDQLADEFFEGTAWGSDDATRKKTMLVYDLGNRGVHPSLMEHDTTRGIRFGTGNSARSHPSNSRKFGNVRFVPVRRVGSPCRSD